MIKQIVFVFDSSTRSLRVVTTEKFLLSELKEIEQIFRNNKHEILMQSGVTKKQIEQQENAKPSL